MFPHEIQRLWGAGSLHEVWEGTGILCLDDRHYSDEFGASVEQVSEMRTLMA
jgi:CRISPR-associated endonuclease/helicase Cas3